MTRGHVLACPPTVPTYRGRGHFSPIGMSSVPSGLHWEPLSRPPRRLVVSCATCPRSEANMSSRLRGWEQAAGFRDTYRCGSCAQVAA